MYNYEDGDSPDIDDPTLFAVFEMFKETMDRHNELYREECEKRRNAANKRWKSEDANACICMHLHTDACNSMLEDADTSHTHILNDVNNNNKQEKEKQGKEKGGVGEKENPAVLEVVEYLNQTCGKRFRAKSAGVKKHISARLAEGFSVDDCKSVIDKKAQEWMGTEWERYLQPSTLFNSEKFEGYLNQPMRCPRSGTREQTNWDEIE